MSESPHETQRPRAQLVEQAARGGSLALIGEVSSKAFAFGLQYVTARILGPSGYGVFALANTLVLVLVRVFLLGSHNGVLRFVSAYKEAGDRARLKGTLISAIGFGGVGGLAGALVLFSSATWLGTNVFHEISLGPLLRLFAAAIPSLVLLQVLTASFRALGRIDLQVYLRQVLCPAATLVLAALALVAGLGLSGIAYAFILGSWLSAGCAYLWGIRVYRTHVLGVAPRYEFGKTVGYSLQTMIIGFLVLWLIYTDRIMLGILGDAEDVGIYNSAFVLSSQISVFLVAISAVFAPMCSGLHHRGKSGELQGVYRLTTRWTISLTLPFAIALVILAQSFMTLFGSGFAEGWKVLGLLAGGQLANAAAGSAGYVLTMTGNQRVELANCLILGLANVALNFWLIPLLGITGAALATGASLAAVNAVRVLEIWFLLRITPYDSGVLKPLLAGVLSVSVGLLFGFGILRVRPLWLVGSSAILCVYVLSLVLLRLPPDDLTVLRLLRERLGRRRQIR